MINDLQSYGLTYVLYAHAECVYVPNSREIRSRIIHEVHSAPSGGHLGVEKTCARLGRYFYWPGQRQEVPQYIESCVSCNSNKSSNQAAAGLLQPLELPTKRWEQISMDFIGPLPVTDKRSNDMILVVVDKSSKMVHLLPCKTTISAAQCACLIFREIVRHHGIPSAIISDRDPRFTSQFWQELWRLCGSRLKMSSAYHPQTDGQTERTNRTVEEILRAFVSTTATDWNDHLTGVEIAINSSKQSSTGFSPYYLNYGQEVNLPLDVALQSAKESLVPAAADIIQQLHNDLHTATVNMQKSRDRQKLQADRHRREVKYSVGDRVMLNNNDWLRVGRKLLPKYWGPFRVIEVLSDVSVKLELPRALSRVHNTFHVSKLKSFKDSELSFPGRQQNDRPPPVVDDADESQWTVESISGKKIVYEKVGKSRRKKARVMYLVNWLGYPIEDSSWVYEESIDDESITEYQQRVDENEDADC